ncbi:biofilm regulation protein kinase SiaB [Zobellella maritima]|uniref:biofilm regulation protein kinase SiaB n=1 Tax=Zobellella maritima TaxID=2059725 RepID=UPI000E307B8B|nr:biofilm regulation protein kinase SiaB [Zobellella maritima]
MHHIELLSLREQFNQNRILICFNGAISHSLIEEIGNALKNYLHEDQAKPSAAMDVFAVYIELTQNIRHYAQRRGYSEMEGAATVVVAKDKDNHYRVLAGNLVELADGQALCDRVTTMAAMDKTELKAAYKAQLRRPRNDNQHGDAGLGLLEVARKTSHPLVSKLTEIGDNRAFFSLLAVI